jgi:sterol desaturase/sphingolipid hydroxylase (fatty acid hydroxylase superfamily)
MRTRREQRDALAMIGIPIAIGLFAYGEWAAHSYLLHWRGRDKNSVFAFHFHTHHQKVRRHGGYDPDFEGPVWSTPTQAGEAAGLAIIGLLHAPLLPVAPFYTMTTWYLLYRYRAVHRRAHIDPEWGRTHLPWHYDHHLGPNQHKNWGVTFEWFDKLRGTRVPYVGTPKELADRKRTRERATAAIENRTAKRASWRGAVKAIRRAVEKRVA